MKQPKIINKNIIGGIAGKRSGNPTGVIIHNDAGAIVCTAEWYVGYLPRHNKANGFAHYYIDKDTIFRAEDTFNIAWHCGNAQFNREYLSYEVCQSIGATDKDFLLNEDMVLRQVAEDMLYYNIPVNMNTVKLHKEVFATACPHRSVALHGGTQETKKYFVSKIKHYQSLGKTVKEMIDKENGKDYNNLKEKVEKDKTMIRQENKPSVFGLDNGVYEFASWSIANQYTGLPYVTAGVFIANRTEHGGLFEWHTTNGRHFVCCIIYNQTKGWIEIGKN